ncbi:hypothetical protein [Dysgonomonas sp. BGC7]|uniref:hypothetical protein n=1 Tax=Dysgonomonas sp. BGC7 TaxID=1658008 RepID=UPI0006834E2A|nr:hypothetical protein [Dysgonomonas sp. BGC7]MBD8388481.1 hypothetical protein [Dysgonomonas sp. BGC7]
MKKKFSRLAVYLSAIIAVAMLTISCSDSNETEKPTDPTEFELKGSLTGERTLLAGNTYTLVGGYQVKNGGKLIIQEGVTINATRSTSKSDYILIEQGGKIDAQGTKSRPIVMTSTQQTPGAWGGIHICGRAPINLTGGTGMSEIGDAPFGGTNEADNSGILRYVRLEYTGFAINETKESNGLTMYGVGNGTTIEYVQTYKGADDGFEWFGGTVNAKYLVSTASEDDSFDWTDGWRGNGQFWVAIQDQKAPGSDGTANGDCLIEADNREDNYKNSPVSCPTLANLTLIGNNDTNKQTRGIRLRAGTYVKMYNVLVTGKPKSVTTATTETETSFTNGNSVIEYLFADKGFTYEQGTALGLDTKTGNGINKTITFTGGYIGTVTGGKDMSSVNSFFTKAEYKGAVPADNDWTAGWTKKL